MRRPLWLLAALLCARVAPAGELPIITLGGVGPDQEIPTDRSFYVRGDADPRVLHAQAVIVRRGSPSLFGWAGPSCHDLIADLDIESTLSSAGDDEELDDDEAAEAPMPTYDAGLHQAFEVFPRATGSARRTAVLISAAWQRSSADERGYRVMVPHDPRFFAAGYGFCLVVVTTEHAQEVPEPTLVELVDGVASKLVACGDKASCDVDTLSDYEIRLARALGGSDAIRRTPGRLGELASMLKEAVREELGQATGLVEALGRMAERNQARQVLAPAARLTWEDLDTEPLAQAVVTLLAQAGELIPQVKGSSVSWHTTDGKLQVKAVQLFDDGGAIRIASSKAPAADQVRVTSLRSDALPLASGLTLFDLIQLGSRRIRVDDEWLSLDEIAAGAAQLGQPAWTAEDSAVLVGAAAQLTRLADYVKLATAGLRCEARGAAAREMEQPGAASRRQLGAWLACQGADAAAIEATRDQLSALIAEEQAWKVAKDKLVARSRRIVTLTSTALTPPYVSFSSRTWLFSYVTPLVGYAAMLRPDDSFGLFYVGAQIHLDPNPVADPPWRYGITTRDLRRALALEVGVAPYRSSFGPDRRFDGPGPLPPLFLGAAVHVLPYTSITVGGAIVDRRNSTLREERPSAVFTPYVGFSFQLNLPDLIRHASGPSTGTTASR